MTKTTWPAGITDEEVTLTIQPTPFLQIDPIPGEHDHYDFTADIRSLSKLDKRSWRPHEIQGVQELMGLTCWNISPR